MSDGFQNVHVRVNDAATNQPTPVRIRFVGPDGKYYAPFGRLTEFATGPAEDVGGNLLLGDKKFAYIDGACEIRLPVGDIEVEIHKGPEYLPLHEKVHLYKGKLALRFVIERWVDLRSQGWYSGDTHCFCLTPHAALLEGAAEDLAVVNLLALPVVLPGHYDPEITSLANILAFSGQRPALERPGHMVVVNTLNKHLREGDLILLNCHRVVYPLTLGAAESVDDWNLADWCEQCHRKAGLVVAPSYLGSRSGEAGELLADAILGLIDAVDIGGVREQDFSVLSPWERLLDGGFRMPLTGGSDKASNEQQLGSPRTYAWHAPGKDFSCKDWIEAVRAGRTFVTTGPLITCTINGQGPGSVVALSGSEEKVSLRAEARSLLPFDTLEIVFNGTVLAATPARTEGALTKAIVDVETIFPAVGWLYARCRGSAAAAAPQRGSAAQTSPIYVEVAGKPHRPRTRTLQYFLMCLEEKMNWINREGHFESDAQRGRVLNVYRQAQAELRRRLEPGYPLAKDGRPRA